MTNEKMKKTYQPKAKEVNREIHKLDADGAVLGRLATEISTYLMGKHKPEFSKHMDMGDIVEVKNASKVKLTGLKDKQKVYRSHSGFPGGFKEVTVAKLRAEQPEKIILFAVKGMLPKNRLQSKRMKRLKVTA